MTGLTTHVLDTALGAPARGLRVTLCILDDAGVFRNLSERDTNDDGRVKDLLGGHEFRTGTYRLRFATGPYLLSHHQSAFYPHVEVVFRVEGPDQHYHVPLLLSPFGYSTYRGS